MVLFPVAAGLYNMLIAKPGFECVHAGVRVLKFSFCSDVQYYQKVCFKAIIYSFFSLRVWRIIYLCQPAFQRLTHKHAAHAYTQHAHICKYNANICI